MVCLALRAFGLISLATGQTHVYVGPGPALWDCRGRWLGGCYIDKWSEKEIGEEGKKEKGSFLP